MRSRVLSGLALAFAQIGLGASIASAIDNFGPVATFCAETGCATVRASAWSHPLGVPMPLLGIAYFAAMLALCVWPRPRLRRALALAGGAWGVGLVCLQAFAIHAWCKLCLVADPAAILGGLSVVAGAGTLRPMRTRALLAVAALGAVVLALRVLAGPHAPVLPSGVPSIVRQAQVPGEVTLVEFVDFECPFCRALQKQLAAALPRVHVPVRIVREMVPLPQHPHAMAAAVAWCCADMQGKGEAMARALFAADPDALTPTGCEHLAAQVGCDLGRYQRDLPLAVGRVATNLLQARAAGIHGLPTLFVGGTQLLGADHDAAELVATIDRAPR